MKQRHLSLNSFAGKRAVKRKLLMNGESASVKGLKEAFSNYTHLTYNNREKKAGQ
jgi:hypothetical protein